MKTIFMTLTMMMTLSTLAQASSGQQFREDIRNLLAAQKLSDQGSVYGSICGNQEDYFQLLTNRKGMLYAVSMNSFSSSDSADGESGIAEVIVVANCTTKKLHY